MTKLLNDSNGVCSIFIANGELGQVVTNVARFIKQGPMFVNNFMNGLLCVKGTKTPVPNSIKSVEGGYVLTVDRNQKRKTWAGDLIDVALYPQGIRRIKPPHPRGPSTTKGIRGKKVADALVDDVAVLNVAETLPFPADNIECAVTIAAAPPPVTETRCAVNPRKKHRTYSSKKKEREAERFLKGAPITDKETEKTLVNHFNKIRMTTSRMDVSAPNPAPEQLELPLGDPREYEKESAEETVQRMAKEVNEKMRGFVGEPNTRETLERIKAGFEHLNEPEDSGPASPASPEEGWDEEPTTQKGTEPSEPVEETWQTGPEDTSLLNVGIKHPPEMKLVGMDTWCAYVSPDTNHRVIPLSHLARRLGYARYRSLQQLAERHVAELKEFGDVETHVVQYTQDLPRGATRIGTMVESYLTIEQALLLSCYAQTDKATKARRELLQLSWKAAGSGLAPGQSEDIRSNSVQAALGDILQELRGNTAAVVPGVCQSIYADNSPLMLALNALASEQLRQRRNVLHLIDSVTSLRTDVAGLLYPPTPPENVVVGPYSTPAPTQVAVPVREEEKVQTQPSDPVYRWLEGLVSEINTNECKSEYEMVKGKVPYTKHVENGKLEMSSVMPQPLTAGRVKSLLRCYVSCYSKVIGKEGSKYTIRRDAYDHVVRLYKWWFYDALCCSQKAVNSKHLTSAGVNAADRVDLKQDELLARLEGIGVSLTAVHDLAARVYNNFPVY
jgi:hypothetical protein